MKYFSTFTGIGGFELGIGEMAECIGYSEIDKYATKIYQSHFPQHHNYGDITKIDPCTLPDFDLLVGGFPCQSFSIAGKRRGFEDIRGTLFFDICRIVKEKRPSLLLLENVKGLLSHDEGRTFSVIIATLDELGYDCQWQVLNSKDFGVPQNRERIFIVANTREGRRPEVFPFGSDADLSEETDGAEKTQSPTEIASTLRTKQGQRADDNYVIGTLRTHKDGNGFREMSEGICPTIPARAREDGSGQPVVFDLKAKGSETRRGAISENGIAKTLDHNCNQGVAVDDPVIFAERGRYNAEGKTEQKAEPRFDGLSNTLTSVEKDNRLFENMAIRRLTPVECERLQGFLDNWTAVVSDTQRYKCCGNAVTVNVIRAIAERLLII